MRTFLRAVVAWAVISAAPGLIADETHARYFEQLRQRSLYSLAESEAMGRLAIPDLPLAARTEFSIELSRTLAEHAGSVSDEQRIEFWQRAAKTVQDVLNRDRANPRAVQLSGQLASVHTVAGDWLRAEREVRPFDEPLLVQATSECSTAIEQWKGVERILTDSTPKKPVNGAPPGHELRTLLHQSRWQLGLSYRNRAELSPPDSIERSRDLAEAEQALRRLTGVADEPLQTRARLTLAVCLRLKGAHERAAEALAALEKTELKVAEAVQEEIIVERARLLLDQNRPTDAAALLLKTRGLRQRLTGEMWFLQTRALIGLRSVALEKHQPELVERLTEQVVTTIDRCDEQVGGFWSRRSHQYWDNVGTAQKYGAELDSIMQQARSDYTVGRIDASLAKYELAEQLAHKQDLADLALELGTTRASILLDGGRFEAAEIEYFRLARAISDPTRAAKSHFLGAYCLGRLYDEKRTQARRLAYMEALDRHLEKYATDPTVNDARFLKAQLEEQRLQSSVALPLYLQVDPSHARGPEAIAGAGRCYELILRRMIEKQLATAELEREAIARLSAFLASAGDAQEKWSIVHAEVAVRLASILMISPTGPTVARPPATASQPRTEDVGEPGSVQRYEQADRWLVRANGLVAQQEREGVANEGNDRLKSRIAALRMIALAGSGNVMEAEKQLAAAESSPQETLNLVERLAQFAIGSDGNRRAQVAALSLKIAERLNADRAGFSVVDADRLDRVLLIGYVSAGQLKESLVIARKQLGASGKDAARQRELAMLFSEKTQQDAQEFTRQCWRSVEAATKAGSAEWMTARLGVITACVQLKQFDEARKLIQVTRVLYPDLKDPQLKARFNALETQLPAARPAIQ